MLFLENVLAPTIPHGWWDNNTSDQNWPIIPGGPLHNVSVVWNETVPARPAYMHSIPENGCAAARRIYDDFLLSRRHERMRITSTSRNPIRNLRVNRNGDDW